MCVFVCACVCVCVYVCVYLCVCVCLRHPSYLRGMPRQQVRVQDTARQAVHP